MSLSPEEHAEMVGAMIRKRATWLSRLRCQLCGHDRRRHPMMRADFVWRFCWRCGAKQ